MCRFLVYSVVLVVLVLAACTEEQRRRQEETHAGARTLEATASLVRDPTVGNAIKEGLSIAQTWFYVLTGIGVTGAAGGGTALAVRNRRSNKRKAVIEDRLAEIDIAITGTPERLNRIESAIAALGQLAKDQAARTEGDTSA